MSYYDNDIIHSACVTLVSRRLSPPRRRRRPNYNFTASELNLVIYITINYDIDEPGRLTCEKHEI